MNNFTQITISNRNFFAFKFFQLHKFVVEKAGKFEKYGQLETSCFKTIAMCFFDLPTQITVNLRTPIDHRHFRFQQFDLSSEFQTDFAHN